MTSENAEKVDPEQIGMALYEKLVDCVEEDASILPELVMKLRDADVSGQFLASSARYLCAVNRERFEPWIVPLVEGAIEKDRERRYISALLEAIWGADYAERVDELNKVDNNFRRIYKRIHPSEGM